MYVDAVHAENVLTFDDFTLRLDGRSVVVVGPNGAGKSCTVRVVDLVQKALDSLSEGTMPGELVFAARAVLASYAGARHHGAPPEREAVVRLAVRFNTVAERRQIATFVRAAVLATLLDDIRRGDHEVAVAIAAWVEAEVTDDRLAGLYRGTIVLRHSGMRHLPWRVSYEFEHEGVTYAWRFGPRTWCVARADTPESALATAPGIDLAERMFGASKSASVFDMPDPLPQFDLGCLCPIRDQVAVNAPRLLIGTGTVDEQLPSFRAAIELFGLPTPTSAGGQRMIVLAAVLGRVLADRMIVVGEQLRGLGASGALPQQQPGPYPWQALASPLRGHSPWQLPLRLFGLKNGDARDQDRFAAIQRMFTELAPGRSFDLAFQATMQPHNPADERAARVENGGDGEWQAAANITIQVDRDAATGPHPRGLPIQLHGAGVWEALVLAEALAEATDRFVILDEPAVTLHPTWQRALRARIRANTGQFLVITHSADLVPIEDRSDLARLVRLENEAGQTVAHRIDLSAFDDGDVREIVQEFALSADALSLLFARNVILLEGDTEPGVLPSWFADAAAVLELPSPAELDAAFWSVGGDRRFHIYIKLLNALAIPWVVICDGAAFDVERRQNANRHIFDQVVDAGADLPELKEFMREFWAGERQRVMDLTLFEEQIKIGARNRVFTLAPGWQTKEAGTDKVNNESFEAFLEKAEPGIGARAVEAVGGKSKPRQGRWIGANMSCPNEVSDLYRNLVDAFSADVAPEPRGE